MGKVYVIGIFGKNVISKNYVYRVDKIKGVITGGHFKKAQKFTTSEEAIAFASYLLSVEPSIAPNFYAVNWSNDDGVYIWSLPNGEEIPAGGWRSAA